MKTKIKWFGIIVIGLLFLGAQVTFAEDVQIIPDPAAGVAVEEMNANLQDALEEIASDREAVIEDIVAMWPAEPGAEDDLRSILSYASDEDLLAILDAGSFAEMESVLAPHTDKDFVFTPVNPCRIVDTRVAGPGIVVAGTSRVYYTHGGGATMAAQGGDPSGCPSPRGEPRGVFINMIAVDPLSKGNIQVRPIGATQGLSVNFNAANNVNLANAGAIKSSYFHASGRDIEVKANFASAHVVIQILGYYHEIRGEDIAASDSSGTITGGVSVGAGFGGYTTLASRTVTIPLSGRVVIMGEASWHNNASNFLGCQFRENGAQVDFWWWEAGDSDGWFDQHQTRFYHKTVTPGTKTYDLRCYRYGGTSATATDRNLTVMFFNADL